MRRLLVIVFMCLLAGCSLEGTKVTQENFERLEEGMNASEVEEILGTPFHIGESFTTYKTISGKTKVGNVIEWYYVVEDGPGIVVTFNENGSVVSKLFSEKEEEE